MATAAEAATDTRYVYRFGGGVSDGGKGDKNLLGGKGANLAEMMSIGLPVPPGFTITTEVCNQYTQNNKSLPEGLEDQVNSALTKVEEIIGKRFGRPENPLLVSVRSASCRCLYNHGVPGPKSIVAGLS